MKELLIIRHAKSSWDDSSLNDFDRPLNTRGLQDAPEMAKRLAERNIQLDLLLTSDAKRAFATCMFFANVFPRAAVKTEHKLYAALPKTIYTEIENIADEYNSVAVFSHNTGITDFVNELTFVRVDIMPTCGIYALRIDTDSWKNFRKAEKIFSFFDYPKNIVR